MWEQRTKPADAAPLSKPRMCHCESRAHSVARLRPGEPCPQMSRRPSRAPIPGADWEQTDALNGVEQHSSAPKRHPTAPSPTCIFSFSQVRDGAASCFTQLHSTAVNSSQRHSISPGGEVSAGQAGKGLVAARTLQVGADWVRVVEVVTAPEVLTHAGKNGWASPAAMWASAWRDLPEKTEVVRVGCFPPACCRLVVLARPTPVAGTILHRRAALDSRRGSR